MLLTGGVVGADQSRFFGMGRFAKLEHNEHFPPTFIQHPHCGHFTLAPTLTELYGLKGRSAIGGDVGAAQSRFLGIGTRLKLEHRVQRPPSFIQQPHCGHFTLSPVFTVLCGLNGMSLIGGLVGTAQSRFVGGGRGATLEQRLHREPCFIQQPHWGHLTRGGVS